MYIDDSLTRVSNLKSELSQTNKELQQLMSNELDYSKKLEKMVPLQKFYYSNRETKIELDSKLNELNITLNNEVADKNKYIELNMELNKQLSLLQNLKQCRNDELQVFYLSKKKDLARETFDLLENSGSKYTFTEIIAEAEKMEGYKIIQVYK